MIINCWMYTRTPAAGHRAARLPIKLVEELARIGGEGDWRKPKAHAQERHGRQQLADDHQRGTHICVPLSAHSDLWRMVRDHAKVTSVGHLDF